MVTVGRMMSRLQDQIKVAVKQLLNGTASQVSLDSRSPDWKPEPAVCLQLC